VTETKPDLSALRIDKAAKGSTGPGWWFWASVAVIAVAAALGGWWYVAGGLAKAVRVGEVVARTQAAGGDAVLNASGYVTARRRATVSSKITGKVVEVHVEEGMAVRAGQVLARLDDTTAQANLALAEAQLDAARRQVTESEVRLAEAERTLERRTQLLKESVIGKAEVDAAQAEVDSYKARIAVAKDQVVVADRAVALRRTELDDTIVRAPFGGVAISKDAQPGEMVSPISAGGGFTRTGICTIVDMSSLEIEVDVNESYINRVRPGQAVTATLDAYPDWPIPAKVITTIPAADRQRATVLVRIGFDQLDPRILPDMGVKVAFLKAGETAAPSPQPRPTLLVPRAAARAGSGGDVVFVVRDDRVERRAVKLGSADGDLVEVVAGLEAGERVVVEGPADLADGDRVVIR
jgi:RND family efflux transporter MFP subunit